jgi:aminoglycoside 6'-N-acetyltransferase
MIDFMDKTIMPIRITTPRLILRSFEDRDILPFSTYRSDPEVAKYQGWETPYSVDQAAAFVKDMQAATPKEPGHWYQIAVELKSTGALIGDVVFHRLLEDPDQAEIGFTLAREHQGQGYAAEAVSRMLDYLFTELNLHRVRANCDPRNLGSIRLMQKLGMRHEGRFLQSLWLKSEWVDEDWYAILQSEWVKKIE